MAGETSNTEKMAKFVSEELFEFFRWKKADLMDENFPCCKPSAHSRKENHTHPVDVVFCAPGTGALLEVQVLPLSLIHI